MDQITNPMKAIRAKCLDCCGDNAQEVRLCTAPNCALYPFRLGKNPYRKRSLTDEQRQALALRLASHKTEQKSV